MNPSRSSYIYGRVHIAIWRIAMTKKTGENLKVAPSVDNLAVEFYNQTVKLYKLKFGRRGHKKTAKWASILRKTEDSHALISNMQLFYDEMIRELSGEIAPPITPTEDNDETGPKEYDNLTLSQRRGRYLAEYMEKNKIKSLKTSEARLILQTVERIRLKPTVVIRALHECGKWINSKLEHIGGRRENRLRIIQPIIIKADEFFNSGNVPSLLRSDPYS